MASVIDARELFTLAADLDGNARKVGDRAVKVTFRAAMNIKRDWQENARAHAPRHAPAFPSSITFEEKNSPGVVETEIGPDKNRAQGALGNLLEFGSVNNPGFGDGQNAADREEDKYLDELAKMADLW